MWVNWALTDGNIVQLIEFVDQRSDDSNIEPHISKLRETEIVLDDAEDVASNPVDVCVDWEMGVRIGLTAVYGLSVVVCRVGPSQKRASLIWSWWGQADVRAIPHCEGGREVGVTIGRPARCDDSGSAGRKYGGCGKQAVGRVAREARWQSTPLRCNLWQGLKRWELRSETGTRYSLV